MNRKDQDIGRKIWTVLFGCCAFFILMIVHIYGMHIIKVKQRKIGQSSPP